MGKRNIIVIGASAGGFDALRTIVKGLPPNLDASIFIVWHMASDVRGILPDVLNKLDSMFAVNANNHEPIKSAVIYVARPDHHLLIEEGIVRVTKGPKENRFRPAIDPLFRSAAYTYGNRVIGIILSGGLDDGTAGLWRIKESGGITVVQDPVDAQVSSMPESALNAVEIDYCLPASEIANLIVKLSSEDVPEQKILKDDKTKIEIDIAAEKISLSRNSTDFGVLSPYSCPECHGVLSKIVDGNLTRFRCHTGHAYSPDTLMAALTQKIEDSLYSAMRGMDESVFLMNHIGDHYAEVNQPKLAAVYFKKAKEAEQRVKALRETIFDHEQLSQGKLVEEAEKKS